MSPTLREPRQTLPDTQSLRAFLRVAPALPPEARYQLVEQALVLLEGAYVHLRLKRAMHAVDPLQRLRLLQHRFETFSDAQFHAELAGIFRSLRDLHTIYQLPDPYRGHVASLGFLVERYYTPAGTPRHLITKIHPALKSGSFQPGVELLAWNGVPIERALELNAERQAGSNSDARLARGLEALTLRPLRTSPPPDEHWVIIEYKRGRGRREELRLPWRVHAAATTSEGQAQDPVSTISAVLGIDSGNEASRQIKRAFFGSAKARAAEAQELHSLLRFQELTLNRRTIGYLRIFSFNTTRARRFVEAIARVLTLLPQGGLIIDIRANPGGHIPAAEATLQLLSNDAIEPARFALATTPFALALCDTNPDMVPWAESVDAAVETGETYSQPLPLSDPVALAEGLPRYTGPVVLITDALSYSAADVFAAGFQDNELGAVLGTARRTGAGGANVWTHDLLRLWLPEMLQPLPFGASFRVAIRRATRVKARHGVPLEDLGVSADESHSLTKRDITERNQDLQVAAARLLLSIS